MQIGNGGSPAELIAQHALLDEIHGLQQEIAQMSEEEPTSPRREHQHLGFSAMTTLVSSSYPFDACPPTQQNTSSIYCTATSVRLSSYNDDSASADELSVTDVFSA